MYLVAAMITEDAQKRALSGMSSHARDHQNTTRQFRHSLKKPNEYVTSKKSVNYEIFQALGETVAPYATKLKKLAASFEFYDTDAKIKAGYAVYGQRTKTSFQGKLKNIILFNMP